MAVTIEISLLSGRRALVRARLDDTVNELRKNAERQLGLDLGVLLTEEGRELLGFGTLLEAGLREGGRVSGTVRRTELISAYGCLQRSGDAWPLDLLWELEAFAALRPDGRVITWGDPGCGGDSSQVQDRLVGVQSISAASRAFAALRSDGAVVTWGDPTYGGDSGPVQKQLRRVKSIHAAAYAFAAVRMDGAAVAWGEHRYGGDCSAVQHRLSDVVDVRNTAHAFAALLANGRVITWGAIASGGDSDAVQADLRNVIRIHATVFAFAALRRDGSVVTWGEPEYGGDSRTVQHLLTDVSEIRATARAFAAVRKDGVVLAWGHNLYGGDYSAVAGHLQDVRQLYASAAAFAALRWDGSVVTWGEAESGGTSAAVQHQLREIQQIHVAVHAFAACRLDGSVVTWGDPRCGGDSSQAQSMLKDVQDICAGAYAFAALCADGTVHSWGEPAFGGDSSALQEELFDIQDVKSSACAFAALRSDGRIFTWGDPRCGGDIDGPQFGKATGWEHAISLLHDMEQHSLVQGTVSFNAALNSLVRQGGHCWETSICFLSRMVQIRLEPDEFSMSPSIAALGDSEGWPVALTLLGGMTTRGLEASAFPRNAALARLEDSSQWQTASSILEAAWRKRSSPDVLACNSAISSCSRAGEAQQARRLLDRMPEMRLAPDTVSINAALSSADWSEALELLAFMSDHDLQVDAFTISTSIRASAGERGRQLFRELSQRGVELNQVAYNAAIGACASGGRWQEAGSLLQEMDEVAIVPDMISFNSAVDVCEKGGQWQMALLLLAEAEKRMLRLDAVGANSALSSCEKCGQLGPSLRLLARMVNLRLSNEISYTCAIGSCEKSGDWQLALHLLEKLPPRAEHPMALPAIHPAVFPGLFISDAEAAAHYAELRSKGITHVAVVARSCKAQFPGAFRYLTLDLLDDGTDNLLPHLSRCFAFLDEAFQAHGRVLVHCFAGASRSASIVTAYLMRTWRLPFSLALQIFKATYPNASPAENFCEQLKVFEAAGFCLGEDGDGLQVPEADLMRGAPPQELWRTALMDLYIRDGMSHACAVENVTECPFTQTLSPELALALQRELVRSLGVRLPVATSPSSVCCCTKCQKPLFSSAHVLHECASGHYVEPMQWMSTSASEGKLNCECGAKLGSFSWTGQSCGCGEWRAPVFCIQNKKVEWRKIGSREVRFVRRLIFQRRGSAGMEGSDVISACPGSQWPLAVDMLGYMERASVFPHEISFNAALAAAARGSAPAPVAAALLQRMRAAEVQPDAGSYKAAATIFETRDMAQPALRIYQEMSGGSADVLWKGLISKNPLHEDAGLVFHGDGIVHEDPERELDDSWLEEELMGFGAPELEVHNAKSTIPSDMEHQRLELRPDALPAPPHVPVRKSRLPRRLWAEGSPADRLDKHLSGPFFRLKLPVAAEILLSVPGAFMGFPHAFFGPTPLLLAWLSSPLGQGRPTALATAALALLGLGGFFGGLAQRFDFIRVTKLFLFLMPGLTLAALHTAPAAAAAVGRASLVSACLAVAFSFPLKASFDRLRPAAALGLDTKRRAPLLRPYIQAMCQGGQSREALPSSDAAVMAANAVILWRCWQSPPAPWAPAAVAVGAFAFAAFGRMYFWAHHLLDVIAGGFMGVCVAKGVLHLGLHHSNRGVLVSF
ncbi:DUSP12, partial [Symbiodinium sp. CCMP2592]